MRIKLLIIANLSLLFSLASYADQNIEIIGGNNAGLTKVGIVGFESDEQTNIADIVANDLTITGEFNVKRYATRDMVESGTQYIISGLVNNGTVNFKLSNNLGESANNLINQSFNFNSKDVRKVGHIGSNVIYKKLTNTPGVFTSKIAYIVKSGGQYSIMVSDYDGYNQKTLLSAHAPIISLAWNNNGEQIAYATYELGKPVVYVQDIYKVNRYVLANFNGSNSSPSFSSDGRQLTVTLSKDYGSHVYLLNNQKYSHHSNATSLINFGTIDTEAAIGKNNSIVFTSNHDGGPQIFMTDLRGSTPVRLTLNLGNYNTSAKLSHDLSKVVFINRNFGVLKTYVMDLATKSAYPVSLNTSLDMSPSFAPNDKLILFSSHDAMYIVNTSGTTQTKLNKISGDIIDQAWANNTP